MSSTFDKLIKEQGSETEEKRKKVLEKIKTLVGAELQVIYKNLNNKACLHMYSICGFLKEVLHQQKLHQI